MDSNITYFQTVEAPPTSYNGAQPTSIQYEPQQVEFHPASFHTTSANQFHGSNTFITTGTVTTIGDERIILQPNQRVHWTTKPNSSSPNACTGVPSSQPQQILITTQPLTNEQDENRRLAFTTDYFIEPNQQPTIITANSIYQPPQATNVKVQRGIKQIGVAPMSERSEKEQIKRAKQAESARLRYHRLDDIQKKELNLKRTLAQKRKRQREREISELDAILRQSGDITDDPEVIEQLREKKMRAKWAEAARRRYNKLDSEERRAHNAKRRLRQMNVKNDKGELIRDEDTIREKVKEKNAKKAEAARQRYHKMSNDEKKLYNQRRTEAFRKRRIEEEQLLATPIGQISGEALERAQQIVVRNARRAEAARNRYQRMNPDERKAYNQKRYTPKRKRDDQPGPSTSSSAQKIRQKDNDEFDALSALEREVMKRTQQAQQALVRQRMNQPPPQQTYLAQTNQPTSNVNFANTTNNTTVGAHLMQQVQQPTQQMQYY
ncbi:hypothetical protein M3Y97_00874500 [Aphelenchoides bicaudatus]|nr:hypothetical protein M3Y97_00874500 [Aphelenchoides bicaudatus]